MRRVYGGVHTQHMQTVQTQQSHHTLSASAISALILVEYTPINPYDAPAGLSNGPSMLNAVRT